jgi:hypothetical protein
MNFLKAIKKLVNHLTREETTVDYNIIQELESAQESETTPIEEETTLNTTIENPYISQVRDWAVKKIDLLHEADRHRNALALAAEFEEWINIPEGLEELDYLCLENEDWIDEQEIDVR